MIEAFLNGNKIKVEDGTTYIELIRQQGENGGKKPYLVKVGGIIKELRRTVKSDEKIEFAYYEEDAVRQAYARTAIFMMLKVYEDIYKKRNGFGLKFKVHNGYYFDTESTSITDEDLKKIKEGFDNLVKSNTAIKKETIDKKSAFERFKKDHLDDASVLFKYIYKPKINIRSIGDYSRYINGELLYDTGFIKYYDIIKFKRGIILILPEGSDDKVVNDFKVSEKYFSTFDYSIDWARNLGINTVGKLNERIAKEEFDDLVIMAESFQDKQIGDIAESIAKSGKKLVFIAGPSSSGKTSFSHRLMYHLKALNLVPHPIACDNFFRNRVDTPKDEKGEYNFELLEAVDTTLLSEKLSQILKGEETEIPHFNFIKGERQYKGDFVTANENDVIILEGIHCLNPKLTPMIDQNAIFKIFVSALTEVSIDAANRIATSDLRLIRRIVRDSRTRGASAKDTIKRWKSVRNGEEVAIFPFQENADILFNSSLIYEFSLLKIRALPSLFAISEDEEVGAVARRLVKILSYFLAATSEAVPRHSLIREFIGDSIMKVG